MEKNNTPKDPAKRKVTYLDLFLQNLWDLYRHIFDVTYLSLKAARLQRAIKIANARFLSSGRQYHVIPVKTSKMWITQYWVMTSEDIKSQKKLKFFYRKNIHVEDVLKLAVYTTPSKLTYEFVERMKIENSLSHKLFGNKK